QRPADAVRAGRAGPLGATGGRSLDNHEVSRRDADPTPPLPAAEPEPTLGQWLARNGPSLVVVAALLVFLYIKFENLDYWALLKMALGLGLVIFIHELGHFLVAKWCDVHVQTFSIGFGPAIPGCSFKWGETTYKLALIPLGGYVQMVGQVDVDESTDPESENDPRSYRNKSVGQRMGIISAGVIMNTITAIVCFVIVFQGPGKNRQAAVISQVDPGSPAFVKGLRTGQQILQIGSRTDPSYERMVATVMNSRAGRTLTIVAQRAQDK